MNTHQKFEEMQQRILRNSNIQKGRTKESIDKKRRFHVMQLQEKTVANTTSLNIIKTPNLQDLQQIEGEEKTVANTTALNVIKTPTLQGLRQIDGAKSPNPNKRLYRAYAEPSKVALSEGTPPPDHISCILGQVPRSKPHHTCTNSGGGNYCMNSYHGAKCTHLQCRMNYDCPNNEICHKNKCQAHKLHLSKAAETTTGSSNTGLIIAVVSVVAFLIFLSFTYRIVYNQG